MLTQTWPTYNRNPELEGALLFELFILRVGMPCFLLLMSSAKARWLQRVPFQPEPVHGASI
jgi:hypothetical protein